jgi:hypothetical protein
MSNEPMEIAMRLLKAYLPTLQERGRKIDDQVSLRWIPRYHESTFHAPVPFHSSRGNVNWEQRLQNEKLNAPKGSAHSERKTLPGVFEGDSKTPSNNPITGSWVAPATQQGAMGADVSFNAIQDRGLLMAINENPDWWRTVQQGAAQESPGGEGFKYGGFDKEAFSKIPTPNISPISMLHYQMALENPMLEEDEVAQRFPDEHELITQFPNIKTEDIWGPPADSTINPFKVASEPMEIAMQLLKRELHPGENQYKHRYKMPNRDDVHPEWYDWIQETLDNPAEYEGIADDFQQPDINHLAGATSREEFFERLYDLHNFQVDDARPPFDDIEGKYRDFTDVPFSEETGFTRSEPMNIAMRLLKNEPADYVDTFRRVDNNIGADGRYMTDEELAEIDARYTKLHDDEDHFEEYYNLLEAIELEQMRRKNESFDGIGYNEETGFTRSEPMEIAMRLLKYQTNLGEHHEDFPSPYGPVVAYHGTTGDDARKIMGGGGLKTHSDNYRTMSTNPSEALSYAIDRSVGHHGGGTHSEPKLLAIRQAAFDQNHPNYIGPSHNFKTAQRQTVDFSDATHYGGNIPRQFLTNTPITNPILENTAQARTNQQNDINTAMSRPALSTQGQIAQRKNTEIDTPNLQQTNQRGEVRPQEPTQNQLSRAKWSRSGQNAEQMMNDYNQQMTQYMQPNPVVQPTDPNQQQLPLQQPQVQQPQVQQPQMIQQGEPMDIAMQLLKERVSPEAKRHKLEYDKKYESSPERVKYREELNRERRRRHIMGQGGPDMSHTSQHTIVPEDPHTNRARHFKDKGTLL